MKDIKAVLENRKSNRNFEGELDLDIVRDSLRVAQRTACSMNAQQISVVMITEQEKLDKLSAINWNQPHIKDAGAFLLFVVDNNRQDAVCQSETSESIEIQNDIESIVVASVDAGLVAQSVELLLQAQGIGTCFIGGVRNNLVEVANIAGVTGIATPIVGMVVGMPKGGIENPVENIRPRVSFDSFFFEERYDEEKVRTGAVEYSEELTQWWANKGKQEHQSYAKSMSKSYRRSYIPTLFDDLQKMGYLSDYTKNEK